MLRVEEWKRPHFTSDAIHFYTLCFPAKHMSLAALIAGLSKCSTVELYTFIFYVQ